MKNFIYTIAVTFIVILSACGDDRSSPSVIQYTGDVEGLFTEARISGVNLYYDALIKTGLDARLSESTERTYLVLNNPAMQAALENSGFLTVAAADEAFLAQLINDHTISGSIITVDEFAKGILTAESGSQIYVSVEDDVVFNSQAVITDGNNIASNGIVHVVNFPMLTFPTSSIGTIVADLSADATTPEFTILDAALEATGLDVTLSSGTSDFTVFAPTDAAFANIGTTLATLATDFTTDELTALLQGHVLAGRFLTQDLASGRTYTLAGGSGTAKGLDISVEVSEIDIEIDAGQTSSTTSVNTLATNGVIHIVDEVLFTEAFIYEALSGDVPIDDPETEQGSLSNFHTALEASSFDYSALLSTETEYTVLVPDAYAGGNTQAELDAYIFEGILDIEDAVGSRIESIGGDQYFVSSTESLDTDRIALYGQNGSSILAKECGADDDACLQDVEAYNGNVTLLAGEVIPLSNISTTSVVQAATDTLDLFFEALIFLELDSLIDVTYLAVQNSELEELYRDAFDAGGVFDQTTIAAGNYAGLITNIESADAATLLAVIQRHIITELFFSLDLVADLEFSNRAGETLDYGTVTVGMSTETGFVINDDTEFTVVEIVQANATGSNGVVHVLESALPEL
ncbi:fasciclin domain-containing protein [Ekhidna sp.]